jgi:hypothetical protein
VAAAGDTGSHDTQEGAAGEGGSHTEGANDERTPARPLETPPPPGLSVKPDFSA